MPEPENSSHRDADHHRHEERIVDAMMQLRRCHPRVFDAIMVVIAHADTRTLDAVAELVDFALGLGAGDLAPSMLHEHARPPERA
jgi:hypothetical protein